MARPKKKPETATIDAAPAPSAEIVPIKPSEPGVKVVWSTFGEKKGAFALGSKHKAGEELEVTADDADKLIARGFAVPA